MAINLQPAEFFKVAFCEKTRANKSRWNKARIFRLGFLVGAGLDAQRIAKDPIISSNASNVYRQVARFGGNFHDADDMGVMLTAEAASCFDKHASRRGLTREKLIQAILLEIAKEPNLLDNILDDGF